MASLEYLQCVGWLPQFSWHPEHVLGTLSVPLSLSATISGRKPKIRELVLNSLGLNTMLGATAWLLAVLRRAASLRGVQQYPRTARAAMTLEYPAPEFQRK
jgi:hypothetical protein